MPEVIVIDLNHATVDGETAGTVFDVADNYPKVDGIKSLTMSALVAWVADRDQAHADSLAARDQAHAEALAAKDETIAARDATIADLQSQIDALGGTPLAQQMAREARIAAAQAAADAAAAELEKAKSEVSP